MTKWGEWPKWNEDESSFRTPNFEFSCSVKDYSGKTSVEQIALLKDRHFLELYRDLTSAEPPQSIFEIGFFQGGMPLFLADMIAPKKIVAVDWNPASEALLNVIERSKLSTSIDLIGNVDQGDGQRIRSILDEKFGSEPLDLIVDDCSHFYHQTKVCFEALFGYLRPGGKYIIEDWAWTHWPGAPWQTDANPFGGTESMTNLIFELVMAMGSDQSTISGINILSHACVVVTRGESLGYKQPIDLRGMTNLADGQRAELLVRGVKPEPAAVAEEPKANAASEQPIAVAEESEPELNFAPISTIVEAPKSKSTSKLKRYLRRYLLAIKGKDDHRKNDHIRALTALVQELGSQRDQLIAQRDKRAAQAPKAASVGKNNKSI